MEKKKLLHSHLLLLVFFSLSVTEFGSNLMSDGPLGFASDFGEGGREGDIVKQDFIAAVDGR